MDPKALSALIERYLREDLSPEETAQLWDSLEQGTGREQWEASLMALLQDKAAHGLSDPKRMEEIYAAIMPEETGSRPLRATGGKYRQWGWWAAAAVLLTGIATGIALWQPKSHQAGIAATPKSPAHEVIPGSNKAVLTLADGSTINLDSAGTGALAQQGNVQVVQTNSGQLAYKPAGVPVSAEIHYNTLAIPRGGQFRLTLPDGTLVWLNAASSIRFPTAFTGANRTVQLTGEAYFEVAKMPAKPFRVQVNNMEVQVLGTHFNVMAYTEEAAVKTTLLEGAVKVNTGSTQTTLHPGQQLQLEKTGQLSVLDNVNVDEIVAWKNGYFQFNHEKLPGVMRQIARWYDVDIAYEGAIPAREFGGKIARSSSIEDVLKILELSKVHFRIEKKKIIVIP